MGNESIDAMRENATRKRRTLDFGAAALTGRPFALTGARVPSLSAFLCSRAICITKLIKRLFCGFSINIIHTLSFLEIGMMKDGLVGYGDEVVSEVECNKINSKFAKKKVIITRAI